MNDNAMFDPQEVHEMNFKSVKSVVEKADKEAYVTLISDYQNEGMEHPIRFFYNPIEGMFILGYNAKVDGFILEDGTVLEDDEVTTFHPSYVHNVIQLHKAYYENQDDFINHAITLWLSIHLFFTFSSELDPSFTIYSIVQQALRRDTNDDEFVMLGHDEAGKFYMHPGKKLITFVDPEGNVQAEFNLNEIPEEEAEEIKVATVVSMINEVLTGIKTKEEVVQ